MRLDGANLSLRPPVMKDAAQILLWENEREVVSVSAHSGDFQLADIEDYIKNIQDVYLDKQLRFIICSNDENLGTLDIFEVDFEAKSAQLGILIGDKAKRRQGLGQEAVKLLISYCRDVLGLSTLLAEVQAANRESQLFFEGLGFIATKTQEEVKLYEYIIRAD